MYLLVANIHVRKHICIPNRCVFVFLPASRITARLLGFSEIFPEVLFFGKNRIKRSIYNKLEGSESVADIISEFVFIGIDKYLFAVTEIAAADGGNINYLLIFTNRRGKVCTVQTGKYVIHL